MLLLRFPPPRCAIFLGGILGVWGFQTYPFFARAYLPCDVGTLYLTKSMFQLQKSVNVDYLTLFTFARKRKFRRTRQAYDFFFNFVI